MEEMDTIDLRELAGVIWRKKWLVLIITTLAVIISGIVSYFVLEPVYETYTTIIVSETKAADQRVEMEDLVLSQKLVNTYGEIAKSNSVSKEVIEKLSLPVSAGQLKSKITVNPVGDTEIIMIKVQDSNPKLAESIANNVAEVFMDNVLALMKVDNVQVIDAAEVPTAPIKPNKKLNVAIAGILGLMLSFGLIVLIEFLDNTIKTPNDVEKYLDLPVLGAIPMMDENTQGTNRK